MSHRGSVTCLSESGEVNDHGPFWIFHLPESLQDVDVDICEDSVLFEGDFARCRKELIRMMRSSPVGQESSVDVMELFAESSLTASLRGHGLSVTTVPSSESENASSASADYRKAVRSALKHHRPSVVMAKWENDRSLDSENLRTRTQKAVASDFAAEVALFQVSAERHFFFDVPEMTVLNPTETMHKVIRDEATVIQSYADQAGRRFQLSSLAIGCGLPVHEGVHEETTPESASHQSFHSGLDGRRAEEKRAKDLLDAQDFSFSACMKLLKDTHLHERHSPRSGIAKSNTGSLVYAFGLFQHGGVWGITRRSRLRPHLTNYLNRFLDWHGAPQNPYKFGGECGNSDKYNLAGSSNAVISFGNHSGGEIWMEERCDPKGGSQCGPCVRELPNGKKLSGYLVNPYQAMVTFDAHYYHLDEPGPGQDRQQMPKVSTCSRLHSPQETNGESSQRDVLPPTGPVRGPSSPLHGDHFYVG